MAQRVVITSQEKSILAQVKVKLGELIDRAFLMTKEKMGPNYSVTDEVFDLTFKAFAAECTQMMILENEMEKGMNLD